MSITKATFVPELQQKGCVSWVGLLHTEWSSIGSWLKQSCKAYCSESENSLEEVLRTELMATELQKLQQGVDDWSETLCSKPRSKKLSGWGVGRSFAEPLRWQDIHEWERPFQQQLSTHCRLEPPSVFQYGFIKTTSC